MRGIIRKADVILGLVLLLLCAGAGWLSWGRKAPGGMIQITADGKLLGEYSLQQEQTIAVDTALGHNQVTIEKGRAYMSEADCPDGYCLSQYRRQGGICSTEQTLVCLPNRVVVSVTGAPKKSGENRQPQPAPDAVAGTAAMEKGGNPS